VRSAKTVWKHDVASAPTAPLDSPPVSPIDDKPPPFEPAKQTPKAKPPRKPRAKPKPKEKEKDQEKDQEQQKAPGADIPNEPSAQPEIRPARSSRKKAPTPKVGGTASPQVTDTLRGPSRSQSVASRTETMSVDNESNVGYVKTEPDIVEEESPATPSHPTSSRRRAGAVQTQQSTKRKRPARAASIAESEDVPPTPGTQIVIAPRHFSRMCNPIMNDIASHKHASTFIAPVKPKDAEGYYDIIKRPTDLKTIQKAISAGAKIVGQAAAALDTPSGSPGGGGGNVVLPLSTDVIPPKAIVNSGQLEKEVMRMFVNAVMFNAGEDGLVEDTREMFETVQQAVSNWRSAERSTGGIESEEIPVTEEDGPTAPKRRKI